MTEIPYGAPVDNDWVENATTPSLKRSYFLKKVFGEEPPQGYEAWIRSLSLPSAEREYYKNKLLGLLVDKIIFTGYVPTEAELPIGADFGSVWYVENTKEGFLWLGTWINLGVVGGTGPKGDPGISAYELAKLEGFTGSLEEWLLSLKGEPGEVTLEYANATYVKNSVFPVNVKDFGAKGDGIADDTDAINLAAEAAEERGNSLYIPPGTYNVGELIFKTDVRIEYGAVLNRIKGNNVINVLGSIEDEIAVSQEISGTSVKTAVPHGYQVGDLIYLMSQRDAISDDAGFEWKLGYPTGGQSCYFAEFVSVDEVVSPTEFKILGGTYYPSYRADSTLETSSTARASSTVQRVTGTRNITIKGGVITGAPANAVYTNWASDIRFEDIVFKTVFDRIGFVAARSFNITFNHCSAYYPRTTSANIYGRNAFKNISSQNVDFDDCYVENGSQCFDWTFSPNWGPATDSTLRNSATKWSQTNTAVSHGGSHRVNVINNMMTNCLGSGINVRSRDSQIRGNQVYGIGISEISCGIRLFEGWAIDCIISDNHVENFYYGYDVLDAPNMGEKFGYIGASYSNNIASRCQVGYRAIRSSTNPYRGESGLSYVNCKVTKARIGGFGFHLGEHIYRAKIDNANLHGSDRGSTAVRLDANCDYTRISFAEIVGWTFRGIDHRGFNSPDLTGSRVYVWGNTFARTGSSQSDRYVATGGGTWLGYPFHGVGTVGTTRGTVSGSRGNNAALASVLTRLSEMGVITDGSSV